MLTHIFPKKRRINASVFTRENTSQRKLAFPRFLRSITRESAKYINDQCSHHIETSHLICNTNQLTGFYMTGKQQLICRWVDKYWKQKPSTTSMSYSINLGIEFCSLMYFYCFFHRKTLEYNLFFLFFLGFP